MAIANTKSAPLEEVLLYRNAALTNYFAAEYGLTKSESKRLFDDLKAWLWLCANKDETYQVRVFNDFRIIDLYWHTFLLFTQDYIDFCQLYFGRIITHDPASHIAARKQARDSTATAEKNLKYIKGSISEVVRLLGVKFAVRFYSEIPKKYGARFAKQLP